MPTATSTRPTTERGVDRIFSAIQHAEPSQLRRPFPIAAAVVIVGLLVGIAVTQVQLSSANQRLSKASSSLATTAKELATTKDALETARGEASAASAKAGQQSGQIATMRKCLSGVDQFFTKAAFGDVGGAETAIMRVSDDCDKAMKFIEAAKNRERSEISKVSY